MALLENWRNQAYGDGLDDKKKNELWERYFKIEKGIYEKLLSDPAQVVEGTVKELAERYGTEVFIMTGFLDGINESLKGYENPIETMEEDTPVKIEIGLALWASPVGFDPGRGEKEGAVQGAEGVRHGAQ